MTDFIAIRQHSSPYVRNRYQVLSLPANPPAYTSGINVGFKVSATPAGYRLFPIHTIRDKADFSKRFSRFLLEAFCKRGSIAVQSILDYVQYSIPCQVFQSV